MKVVKAIYLMCIVIQSLGLAHYQKQQEDFGFVIIMLVSDVQ
jgi:hypothetical protein